jgi:predicted nucleic-acid-binding Zn-ribbon protein
MKECPRCRAGKMSEGFMLDRGESNSRNVQKWIEGEPERSFWLGLQTKGREAFEITTWRCDRCGYLESYALTPVK